MCEDGDTFPADIALMTSSDDGGCFIKTSSLDGEKNLKKRIQVKGLKAYFDVTNANLKQYNGVKGHLEVEQPNKDLHTFKGTLYLDGGSKMFSFSQDQLLLKGANLANTEWVVGVVAYTGEQTKIMLNSQKGRVKMSHLEGMVNQLVIYIIMSQVCICVTMAILTQIWQVKSDFDNVVLQDKNSEKLDSFLSFFTYFVLMNTLLPISLSVTLEVCKFVQGNLIEWDALIYSEERDKPVKVQTFSIVEDLGQVGYIFSDKTGTLTRNIMEFKYMLVGNEFYGDQDVFE